MAPLPISFGIESKPGEFGHEGISRLINAYVEQMGVEGKSPLILKASPGLKTFGSTLTTAGPVRGMLVLPGALYVVAGVQLFFIDPTGTATSLGGIPGNNPVFMARNKKTPFPEIAIVSDGLRFICQTAADVGSHTLSTIADADLPPPLGVIFIDGYFIFAIEDGRFFISAINDGTSISSADFAEAEGDPDGLVSIGKRSRELWLFGEESIEVYQNTGATFPFERLPGVFIEKGCLARYSATPFIGSIAWVDNTGIVRLANGYTPQRISDHQVERDIRRLSDKSTIKAFTWESDGHEFLHLTSSDWSWVYDAVTGQWHEMKSYQKNFNRRLWAVQFEGKCIHGDAETGKLYEMDQDTYDEAGNAFIWETSAPNVHSYPNRIRVNAFWADLIPGVGLNDPDPALKDPKVLFDYSIDGGKQWKAERSLPLGKIGEPNVRVRANRLGAFSQNGLTPRLRISAAVARGLVQAAMDIDELGP